MSNQEKEPLKQVKVTLKAPHTHAGKLYKKGNQITVREDQAKRLIKANIAAGE